jgi:magnesium chelatase family protein
VSDERLGEDSADVQERVSQARKIQAERFKGSKLICNAEMTPAEIRDFCHTDEAAAACSRRP